MDHAQAAPAMVTMDNDPCAAKRFKFSAARGQFGHGYQAGRLDVDQFVFIRLAAIDQDDITTGVQATLGTLAINFQWQGLGSRTCHEQPLGNRRG
jgi:hypothetical protein